MAAAKEGTLRHPEYLQCKALVEYAHMKGWLILHLANEGKRAAHVAKAMGIVAGASDYFIPTPSDQFHGLWIEMKAPGRKPSRAQVVFLELMRRQGYAAAWFDDWQKAAAFIEDYLA